MVQVLFTMKLQTDKYTLCISDHDEDDDVEGYFCTVCDIKIPDIDKHIQQFHCGQEVILQVRTFLVLST